MSDDNKENEILDVKEEVDGSAVVELPKDIQSPDAPVVEVAEDSDEADEVARQAEMANGGAIDEEAEAVREAKRSKRRARKEYHKQVSAEKDHKLSYLERQNQELLERLAVVEKKTQGSEIARLNKAKEDLETRILFAKQKIEEATSTGDGKMLTSAQEMWFDARRNYEALDNLIKQSVQPQQQRTIQAPDPLVQRYASDWMTENNWYDPNGGDTDSRIALQIDQDMSKEGWNPKSQEYWEELDNRLQKYLPHRYNEEETHVSPSTRRPRNVVTSSGRESAASSGGKGNTFTLTSDQVRAMKDAGMWDDPDKRAKMIRRYATEKISQR
jgi:hypothetical protein